MLKQPVSTKILHHKTYNVSFWGCSFQPILGRGVGSKVKVRRVGQIPTQSVQNFFFGEPPLFFGPPILTSDRNKACYVLDDWSDFL